MKILNESGSPRPISLSKKILFTALAIVISLSGSLIAMEVILQILMGSVHNEVTNVDPILHHFTGDNPHTNSFGFYDKEYSKTKSENTYRIMILGDSLIRRGYNGALLTDELETLMQNYHPDKSIEVWNLGVDSYATALEYLLLRHKVLAFQPDLLVISFFVGNDFNDDAVYNAKMEFDPDGLPIRCPPDNEANEAQLVPGQLRIPFKNYLRNHSRLYREMSKVYNTILHFTGIRDGEWGKAKIDINQTAPIGTLIIRISDEIFNNTTKYFLFIDQLLKQHSIPYVVMLIPLDLQISDLAYKQDNRNNPFKDEDVKQLDVNLNRLNSFLEQHNIRTLNLTPLLKQSSIQPLYIVGSHFNEHGHTLVAKILQKRINEMMEKQQGHLDGNAH